MQIRSFAGLVAGIVFCSQFAVAQETRASVYGTVTDPAGAVIPGAAVQARNVEKGTTFRSVSNNAGIYTLSYLPLGRYTVEIEAKGFKKFVRQDIVLGINDKLGLDAQLEVGQTTEAITVTGEAAMLQTETASRGGSVEQQLIEGMPNNGRNAMNVVFATPGVYKPSTAQGNSFGFNGTGNMTPSINGSAAGSSGREWNTEILVDGTANNRMTKEIVTPPAIEAIQELQVLTNTYDASYGHTAGGVISMVTKSGNNSFHGVVFDRMANNRWRTQTWVENYNKTRKSNTTLHNYGFMASGPIFIPKIVDGRNRVFWMLSWDKTPSDSSFRSLSSVPTPAMKGGDFSGLMASNGQPVLVYDPLTTRMGADGKYVRDPFSSNKIPNPRINAVSSKILSYFPDPNRPGTGPSGIVDNFLYSGNQTDVMPQHMGRLDYRMNDRDSFFGRFTVSDQLRNGTNKFGPNSPAEPERTARGTAGRLFTFDWTRTISPTLIWDIRVGWARSQEIAGSDLSRNFDTATLGFSGTLLNQLPYRNYPWFGFGSYSNQGTDSVDNFDANDTYSVSPTLNKVWRNHIMKFGGEYRWFRANHVTRGMGAGQYNFNRDWTQRNPLQADANSGDEIATALLGYPSSGNVDIAMSPAYGQRYYVGFFQDDWKINRKLTLNLGLRWDLETPPTERYNRQLRGFAFDRAPSIAAAVKNAPGASNCPACSNLMGGGPYFAGLNGTARNAFNPRYVNFQPRIGVAYALTSKTILRGGFGLYYMQVGESVGDKLGFSASTSAVTSTDGGLTPNVIIDNAFINGLNKPTGSSLGFDTNLGLGISAQYMDRDYARSHQYSIGVQRELPLQFTIDASYVGNLATHLPMGGGPNVMPASEYFKTAAYYNEKVTNPFAGLVNKTSALNAATVTRSSLLVPIPQYGIGVSNVSIGRNRYDSAQFQLRRRFSNGLTLQVNYTIAKTLEQLGTQTSLDTRWPNVEDTKLKKQLTTFDVPQRWSFIGVYELPFGKGRQWGNQMPYVANFLLGGWKLGYNITQQSGFPVDFPNAPNLEARSAKLAVEKRDMFKWFDTSLFNKTVPLGEPYALRMWPTRFPDVRFMDLHAADLDLSKDFVIREGVKLQFRVTCINVSNTPFFPQMQSLDVTNARFGQLQINQRNDPRNYYADFRLVW